MANLASHKHGVPQDGKAAPPEFDGVQLRVSVFPTVKGEKIVMRIFNPQARTFDINSLGFDEETLDKFVTVLNKPTGLILLTGPTGSGKTTAIYAAIGHLLEKNQNAIAIASVEDPVEQNLMSTVIHIKTHVETFVLRHHKLHSNVEESWIPVAAWLPPQGYTCR